MLVFMSARKKAREWAQIPEFSSALSELPRRERVKRFPPFAGVSHALRAVIRLDSVIEACSRLEKTPKAAVQAVLFREVLGFGWEDLADGFRKNASRGLCQIRPSTALKADEALGYPLMQITQYCRKLMSKRWNVLYCARVLRAEARSFSQDLFALRDEEWLEVFRRYNGGMQYAKCVIGYFRAFERIGSLSVTQDASAGGTVS